MAEQSFEAYRVSENAENNFESAIIKRSINELAPSDLLIKVSYSSLNYKDALSASGNKGVTREFPHTPGIDAAGVVVSSKSKNFDAGDQVIVTGYDLGMNTDGGFGQYISVPSDWAVPLPENLGLRESMVLGTAGLTAGLSVKKLIDAGLTPENGDILVTGATGGVGVLAIALLIKLGFGVTASTGKASEIAFLQALGAQVIDRVELSEASSKPLLRERWGGAIDVVGGETLVNVLKQIKNGGSVAACGLVESPSIALTVLPFILRGVNLLGIDSVEIPLATKRNVWNKFAGDWKIDNLEDLVTEISMAELSDKLKLLLAGNAKGRYVLSMSS